MKPIRIQYKINESKNVKVSDIGFMFSVEGDPVRARFVPQTSDDLDKLDGEKNVKSVMSAIEQRLSSSTGYKWNHDALDRGAGYSFLPDEGGLAKSIESSMK